jgi:DNA polymerase-3 subunit delta'
VSFDKVKHQKGAVRALRAAVASDRMPHAFLFAGPRGVGKGLAARELAKVLLCETPRDAGADGRDSCDACSPCERVERGTHPDVYWFRKEPDRNDFRLALVTRRPRETPAWLTVTVNESVVLAPMEGPRTVTVLDDAELMNEEAANALLKSLEEPARHAVLVLLCADVSRLPATILSRCQWVRFRPLPDAFVAERVRALLPPEDGAVSDAEVAYASRFAGGSIERARALVGSGLWDLKRAVVPLLAEMEESAALDIAERIAAWSRQRAKADSVTDESREETALRREAARTALAAVASALRDALVLATVGEETPALVNADQPEAIRALAAWPGEALLRAVGLLADAQRHISRYVHTELATENALIQVSRLRAVRAGA